ncbi:conserved hypothetical protein [Leishmania mexicana MHOM/GT/2001/U1103]|uniref:Uncharacterized protein n=1 Tax=Leishmania mexicana (strain MHOM/GT/2001/U1103) TaxID=929439 RepID=E9AY08_LEIMU|nr:conserved hypothetical protein [Leishmania mexicana MHOM/GT/2001/U1103]CBZ27849.1 conserved hypothetical protein [Leishmania mexicana MHOM/GT/2001/U1103]
MNEIHGVCLALVKAVPEARPTILVSFASSIEVIWTVARRQLTEEERTQSARFKVYAEAFVAMLHRCVRDAADGGTVALCRSLQRLLEEQGFPEAEFGPLASYLAELLLEEDVQGYSYSERTSLVMPMPVRYEGDKRAEEEHSRKRAGFEVVLPLLHPHPEVNTVIQLSEPKRRKPALDEYRIFSLPKKAAGFAADDFVVDDELLHRAYVVLATHLDAYGSLKGLSPYARLLLWNLLDRNDTLFSALYDQHATSEAMRQQLLKVRELLAVHKQAFEETRVAARQTASLVGWYATSAQWRDQALSRLGELEDSDWYLLADVYRSGGKAIFPNYARSNAVAHLALGVVRKLDKIHGQELDGAPPMHNVVLQLLLPLLMGEAPEIGEYCFGHGAFTANSPHWQRGRRKLKTVMDEVARRTTLSTARTSASSQDSVCTYLCASLIFPLQCFGELLEMCSLVIFSPMGFDAFTRSFLATNWEEEDAILAYLLRREPANPSLVPLVGIPRVYKDMVTSVQLLMADKMVPYVVESRRLAGEHAQASVQHRSYPYWKALCTMFAEEDRFDDLCELQVSTKEDLTRLYTAAGFELVPKVWPEDLVELCEEEASCRCGTG